MTIKNMRIHFYGVQGSGSIFPEKAEREETRMYSDLELLEQVFLEIERNSEAGSINKSVAELIGGPISRKTLTKYRNKFNLCEQRVYGGWTTCFRIETADGNDIVFDCGSGFRICAGHIAGKWADLDERHLYIFGSHAHFDHTEGFDQAAVCFDRGTIFTSWPTTTT